MKRKSRSLLSLFISFLLLTGIIPVHAAGIVASGSCGEHLTWTLDSDGFLTIEGKGEMENWEMSSMRPWQEYASQIKKVSIENGVTSITHGAFVDCGNLSSVSIPGSVTSIGNAAFAYCSNLSSIEIPESVDFLGDLVFEDCSKIERFSVDPDNQTFSSADGVLYNRSRTVLIAYPAGKIDESFVIPQEVRSITTRAFVNCSYLANIEIPYGMTELDDAFMGCGRLETVTLPSSIAELSTPFAYCDSMKTIDYLGTEEQWNKIKIEDYDHSPGSVNNLQVKFHKWDAGKTIKGATCTGEGESLFSCAECGRTKTEPVPKKDHTDNDGDGYCEVCKRNILLDNAPPLFGEESVYYSENPEKGICLTRGLCVFTTSPDLLIEDVKCRLKGATHYGAINIDLTKKTPILDVFQSYTIVDGKDGDRYSFFMLADLDQDKTVSAADARLALRCSIGLEPDLYYACKLASDVNFDNDISAQDARLILRIALDLDSLSDMIPG